MTTITSALSASGYTMLPQVRTISTVTGTYACVFAGRGKPTVILESGLGDGMGTWSTLFRQIEEISQVFAYNRAGYRKSHSENSQRDGCTIVEELRELLAVANVNPPYLLVGHSMGGTYMELYARIYPDEVAGVVFVDSRHADFTRRCQEANVSLDDPSAKLTVLLPAGAKRELKAGDLTMRQVHESPPFPAIPVAVLTGMNKPSEGDKFREIWLSTQTDLAGLSPLSKHIICQACGHYLHHENAVAVLKAIRWVMQTHLS